MTVAYCPSKSFPLPRVNSCTHITCSNLGPSAHPFYYRKSIDKFDSRLGSTYKESWYGYEMVGYSGLCIIIHRRVVWGRRGNHWCRMIRIILGRGWRCRRSRASGRLTLVVRWEGNPVRWSSKKQSAHPPSKQPIYSPTNTQPADSNAKNGWVNDNHHDFS